MTTEAKVTLTPSRLKDLLLTPGWVYTQRFDDFIPGNPTRLAYLSRDMSLGEVTIRHFVELRLDRENKQVDLKEDHNFEGWLLVEGHLVGEDGAELDACMHEALTSVVQQCWVSDPAKAAHLFDLDLSRAFDPLPRS